MDMKFFPFVENIFLFPLSAFGVFAENQLIVSLRVYFWILYCFIDQFAYLYATTYIFMVVVASEYLLKWGCESSNFVHFKVVWATLNPLIVPCDF